MSPAFTKWSYGYAERYVLRYRMPEPKVGDIIERDGEQWQITRASVRAATKSDLEMWPDMHPIFDRIVTIEYEPLEAAE
jgi:hypothetical protein